MLSGKKRIANYLEIWYNIIIIKHIPNLKEVKSDD